MNWKGLLGLLLAVGLNLALLLSYYLAALALVDLLLPPGWTALLRFLLFFLLGLATIPAWLTWKRIHRWLWSRLGPEWQPSWEPLERWLSGGRRG